jgi:SAM-dependent methyltransferase
MQDLYTSGEYLNKNPLWHVDESPWKAKYILRILAKNGIRPKTVCDVGCGAGEVLRLMQESLDPETRFWGYEISPQAFQLCQCRANDRLQFKQADITMEKVSQFDLILLMDILEHLENYFDFLRDIQPRSKYKLIHIPLDISVRTVCCNSLPRFRATYGHLHSFTKETALQTLRDAGYEVIDYLYTWQYNSFRFIWSTNKDDPKRLGQQLAAGAAKRLLSLPSQILFAVHQDLAARVMGQWRLLVLAT